MPLRQTVGRALQRMGQRLGGGGGNGPPNRRLADGNWGWPDFGLGAGGPGPGPYAGGPVSMQGASVAPRLSPWRPNRQHINSIMMAEGAMLRARTRQLIANSPYGSNASDTFVSYATGVGIKPSSLLDNTTKKEALETLWGDWCNEADADGLTDFYGLQSMVARSVFDAGECFVRFRPRMSRDGLSVPLQLQLLEAEQLDNTYTTMSGPTGNPIRMGIEFNAIGQRVAYWFWVQHPGDYTTITYDMRRVRVPASQVLHIFRPLRPGQIRGRPWITAGMVKLYDLDQYDDAELARKKGAAMFMAFLTKGLNTDAQVANYLEGATPPDQTGTSDLVMEPSVMNILPDGMDVKFSEPADVGPNYEAFQVRNLYALCAAMGLPYHAVTGDVSRANYSSLRASLIEVRRRIEQFQSEVMIYQFCRPVWTRWVDTAVLSGGVSLPGYARDPRTAARVKWIKPRWDWVDPLKDAQAEKLAVDSGFKSRSDVIEGEGEDPIATDKRIAADHAREEELGLSFAVGFSKSPDKPQPGSDVEPGEPTDTTAGETGEGAGGEAPPSTAARAEDGGLDAVIRALAAQPPTTVNVNLPPRGTERTRVTKHDAAGRILEFERDEIAS